MKSSQKSDLIGRRDFLRQSACAALGITGLVNTLAYMRLVTAAMAQSTTALTDYKALVCLFLNGGNDSNNLLVPRGGSFRTDYETARGILALPAANLAPIIP